jgi:hypothetical protein
VQVVPGESLFLTLIEDQCRVRGRALPGQWQSASSP